MRRGGGGMRRDGMERRHGGRGNGMERRYILWVYTSHMRTSACMASGC